MFIDSHYYWSYILKQVNGFHTSSQKHDRKMSVLELVRNPALLHLFIYDIELSYISQPRTGRAGKGNHMNCDEKKDESDEIPFTV